MLTLITIKNWVVNWFKTEGTCTFSWLCIIGALLFAFNAGQLSKDNELLRLKVDMKNSQLDYESKLKNLSESYREHERLNYEGVVTAMDRFTKDMNDGNAKSKDLTTKLSDHLNRMRQQDNASYDAGTASTMPGAPSSTSRDDGATSDGFLRKHGKDAIQLAEDAQSCAVRLQLCQKYVETIQYNQSKLIDKKN